MSIASTLQSIETQLQELLADRFIDDSLFAGLLSFTHSKFSIWLTAKFDAEILDKEFSSAQKENNEPQQQQKVHDFSNKNISDETFQTINLLEYLWLNVHSKILQYFYLQFHQLKIEQLQSKTASQPNTSQPNLHITYVTFKKIFGKFRKLNKLIVDFYSEIIHHILTSYNISNSVFPGLYKFYRIASPNDSKTAASEIQSEEKISKLIFFLHRITFFQGNLSRYKSLFYLYVLSSSSSILNKEDRTTAIRFDSFDKSLEFFNLSIMLLPGFSDPFYHIAMVMNSYGHISNYNILSVLGSLNVMPISKKPPIVNGDKFEAVYYFMRGSNQRLGNNAGLESIQKILAVDNRGNAMLHYFTVELKNSKGAEAMFLIHPSGQSKVAKNRLLENAIKIYFLLLFSWYFYPKASVLGKILSAEEISSKAIHLAVKEISNGFFNIIKNAISFNDKNIDILLKQVIILIGGFQVLLSNDELAKGGKNITEFNDLSETTQAYLKFAFTFLVEVLNILIIDHKKFNLTFPLSLEEDGSKFELKNRFSFYLPVIRVILGWIRPSKLLLRFARSHLEFTSKLAFVVNDIYVHVALKNHDQDILAHRYQRLRYFGEDTLLKDYKPINFYFQDFKDDFINKSKFANMRLVGELPQPITVSGKTKPVDPENVDGKLIADEDLLRLYAIGWLGRRIVFSNAFDIEFSSETRQFNINKYKAEVLDTSTEYIKRDNNNRFIDLKAKSKKSANGVNNKKNRNRKSKSFDQSNGKWRQKDNTDFDEEQGYERPLSHAARDSNNKPERAKLPEKFKDAEEFDNFEEFEDFEDFDYAGEFKDVSENEPDFENGKAYKANDICELQNDAIESKIKDAEDIDSDDTGNSDEIETLEFSSSIDGNSQSGIKPKELHSEVATEIGKTRNTVTNQIKSQEDERYLYMVDSLVDDRSSLSPFGLNSSSNNSAEKFRGTTIGKNADFVKEIWSSSNTTNTANNTANSTQSPNIKKQVPISLSELESNFVLGCSYGNITGSPQVDNAATGHTGYHNQPLNYATAQPYQAPPQVTSLYSNSVYNQPYSQYYHPSPQQQQTYQPQPYAYQQVPAGPYLSSQPQVQPNQQHQQHQSSFYSYFSSSPMPQLSNVAPEYYGYNTAASVSATPNASSSNAGNFANDSTGRRNYGGGAGATK